MLVVAQVYNNIISRPQFGGICVQNGNGGRGGSTTPTWNLYVFNNTIWGSQSGTARPNGIVIRDQTANVQVMNNIISNVSGDAYSLTAASLTGLTLDYNLIDSAAVCQVRWNVPAYSNTPSGGTCSFLSQYQASNPTLDNHSLVGLAGFVNPPSDFHLSSSSGAIGAGTDLSAFFVTDFYRASRSGIWSVGAVAP